MKGTIWKRLQRLLATAALVLSCPVAFALGLGEANVQSYMQQPLDARITLITRSEAELASVTARLASADDFRVIGLNRGMLSVPLTFEVVPEITDPHIRVRSRLPITDPVIQVVMEVTWSSGRMIRQYTLFLDPPTFLSAAPLPAPARPEPDVQGEPVVLAEPDPPLNRVEVIDEPPASRDTQGDTAAERETPGSEALSVATPPSAPEPLIVETDGPATDVQQAAETEGLPETPAIADRSPAVGTGPDFQPPEEEADLPVEDAVTSDITPENAAVDSASPALEASPALSDSTAQAPGEGIDESTEALAETAAGATPPDEAAREVAAGDDDASAVTPPVQAQEAAEQEADPEAADWVAQSTAEEDQETRESGAEMAAVGSGSDEADSTDQVAEPAPVEEAMLAAPSRPAASADVNTEPVSAYRAVLPEAGQAQTVAVQRGDTLWQIAVDWNSGGEYQVNQVMLAIQQSNPEAFNRGNINSLKSGSILRMPSAEEVGRISGREAMLEVMRQEDAYRNRWNDQAELSNVPVLAEALNEPAAELASEPAAETPPQGSEPAADESAEEPSLEEAPLEAALSEEAALADAGHLELVPPSPEAADAGNGLGEGSNEGSGVSEGESVVEELARTREDLVNAQQENEYLAERIDELEAELARRAAEPETGVADTGLAEMEARLEAERLDPEAAEEPVAVTRPREVQPWYERLGWWFAGLLLLVVAATIWWLRSRPTIEEQVDFEMQAVVEEASDVLRVLGSEEHVTAETPDEGDFERPDDLDLSTRLDLRNFKPPIDEAHSEEAVELDSNDPETKLDLARAYLSMGDEDAARRMLEEVLDTGSEDQIAEARGMMDEL